MTNESTAITLTNLLNLLLRKALYKKFFENNPKSKNHLTLVQVYYSVLPKSFVTIWLEKLPSESLNDTQ